MCKVISIVNQKGGCSKTTSAVNIGIGMMTINALVAADEVIIPVQAAYLPVKGLQQLMKTINMVKRRLHTKWKILLILYVRVCSPSAPLQ